MKLIVTPIDMAAAGSYRERRRLFRAYADVGHAKQRMDKAQEDAERRKKEKADGKAPMVNENDESATEAMLAFFEANDRLDAVLLPHLETDDGTSVDEALELISAEDYDALFAALTAEPTVPNAKSET